jgi:hypothetical protein
MQGVIYTPLGKDIPVWITTESGSRTQLIQGDYARSLKLPRKALKGWSYFNISSPGGGKEFVNEYAKTQPVMGHQMRRHDLLKNKPG